MTWGHSVHRSERSSLPRCNLRMLDLQAFPPYSLDAPQEEFAYRVEQGSREKWRNIGSLITSITGWQRSERPMNLFSC